MKKIGFIVQRDFLTAHFGVRNLFMTLKSICDRQYDTEFLVHMPSEGRVSWYVCDVTGYLKNIAKRKQCIEFDAEKWAHYIHYSTFQKFIRKNGTGQAVQNQYFRGIGQDLRTEGYDLLVFTNPWLIDFEGKLPVKKLAGIVHDITANKFSLTQPTVDFNWAYQHNRGYLYYNKYCDVLFGNSVSTAEEYNKYYRTDLCVGLPPFLPYAFRDAEYTGEKKENAMVLAAPFDPRKGIEQMPELINSAADLIDTLYIFGMPRCPEEMFDQFFKSLKVRQIKYYPFIEDEELISLYKRCKVLLFPSLEEGLGIPIIEAQVCGCRVVTTDKEPMNQLAGPGCYLLKEGAAEENAAAIRSMMACDDFDYVSMSGVAKERFSYDRVLEMIREVVGE